MDAKYCEKQIQEEYEKINIYIAALKTAVAEQNKLQIIKIAQLITDSNESMMYYTKTKEELENGAQ